MFTSGLDAIDKKEFKEKALGSETQEKTNVEQKEREIEVAFLCLVNESKTTVDLVHSTVSFFRERFGLEAVGVRLKYGDDYPYFETSGFPKEFVKMENQLCVGDEIENHICNSAGNPILKCMCGNVINEQFDPSKPFFTASGSFWTNSTTKLLATTANSDRQAGMCNNCNSFGYESVALIALRVDKDILGILQLNDTRMGQFSPETTTLWERLGGHLAVALFKARVEELLLEAYENLLIQSDKLEIKTEELQKINEALSESEEKYRNIIETANEGISLINSKGILTYVNKKMADMLEYTTIEIIGKTIWELIEKEDEDYVMTNWEKSSLDTVDSYDFKLRCKDGSPLWVLINSKPFFDGNGKLLGSLNMLTDITERKQAEKALQESEMRFRALAENSPDIITRFDRQYRHVYANPAAVKSYGFSIDEIIGKKQSELGRSPKNVKFWEEQLENTFSTGKTDTLEYYYISPQGKRYYFNTKIVPEFAAGKINSVLAISRDITDIKEAEVKLNETLDNLENLVKERTTELKEAYELLKEREAGLAEAQKMAQIGSWDWNILTNNLYYSDELYRIFGLTPQGSDFSFDEVLNYIYPDDRDYVNNAVKEALNGNRYGEIDFRVVLADGTERVVHAQGEVIFNENNNPVRIKGTVQDITERTQSEEKIRNLANIVESSKDAIGTVSLEGIINNWNKGAEQVYGYSAEEILGKPSSILAPSHLREETKKLSERIKQGESIHHYETIRQRKDGRIINVSRTLSPVFDSHGKINAISFISRDITERKITEEKLLESEEKYRNIVETANEGILIIDNEAKITYANKRMSDMLGYTLEESIGKPIWDFLSEESKAIVKLSLKNRWLGIDDSYELKLIKKDGSLLWALINAKSLFDKNGEFAGSMSMLTDITMRKEAEQALASFEIAREKEIHHRIKNNLQVVSSLLDLQTSKFKGRDDIKDSEVMDAFQESQNRVISMALIHEELHKGSGPGTINFSEYIERLAENLLSTYRIGNKDISLNKDLDENIFFDMDTAIPLGTIINELISNSFKYAFPHRDKGEIRIKLHREEGDFIQIREESKSEDFKSTCFVLSVSDNGIGIPENIDIEELDSLGLQLVTSLVAQINGELEIKRNNGTEFNIGFIAIEKNNQSPELIPYKCKSLVREVRFERTNSYETRL